MNKVEVLNKTREPAKKRVLVEGWTDAANEVWQRYVKKKPPLVVK